MTTPNSSATTIGCTSLGTDTPTSLPSVATSRIEMRYASATVARLTSGASSARKYRPTAPSTSSSVAISTSGRCDAITSACWARAAIAPVTPTNASGARGAT